MWSLDTKKKLWSYVILHNFLFGKLVKILNNKSNNVKIIFKTQKRFTQNYRL